MSNIKLIGINVGGAPSRDMTTTRQLTEYARLVPATLNGDSTKSRFLLYGADTPNTHKVATVFEELGIPYDVYLINISQNEQKEPWYKKLNPNERTPTLVDRHWGDGGFAVFESAAIMLYICSVHALQESDCKLIPNDQRRRSEIEQWLMWQMSALGPMMGNCMYFKRIAAPVTKDVSTLQFGIERYENESYRLLKVIDDRIGSGRDFLCGPVPGEYSLADIACFSYARQHWWGGLDITGMPHLQRWLDVVGSRPAVKLGHSVPNGREAWQLSEEGASLRHAIEENAAAAGRPHFGWRDIAEVKGGDNERASFYKAKL